jgi:hypothetical protein
MTFTVSIYQKCRGQKKKNSAVCVFVGRKRLRLLTISCFPVITSLNPQDQQRFSDQIEEDSSRREPPNERISQEIDLSMLFSPTNKTGRTNQQLARSKTKKR